MIDTANPLLTKEALDFARTNVKALVSGLATNVDTEAYLTVQLAEAWQCGRGYGRREKADEVRRAIGCVQ